MTFHDLNIDQDLIESLTRNNITEPFPIQKLTIPFALQGQDLIAQASTGTGKTFAFGLPIIQRIGQPEHRKTLALIVVPTRELCMQVKTSLLSVCSHRTIGITDIYGGKAYSQQIASLKKGAHIVVGTPGRLLDLAKRGSLDLSSVRYSVLDEADKMLDMGFMPDIEQIFSLLPHKRHTMLFSATMPAPIIKLAQKFLTNHIHVQADSTHETTLNPNIQNLIYQVHPMDKDEIVTRILQAKERNKTVIFVRTKRGAQQLTESIKERGFRVCSVHGGLSQERRERAMNAYRTGKKDVLIATDVAARGIDVDDITHVINYDLPEDNETYLHRVGRTGRAGKTGIAITFVTWQEARKWKSMNRLLNLNIPIGLETYSSSEHLYTDLKIPLEAKDATARAHTPPKRVHTSTPKKSFSPQTSRTREDAEQSQEKNTRRKKPRNNKANAASRKEHVRNTTDPREKSTHEHEHKTSQRKKPRTKKFRSEQENSASRRTSHHDSSSSKRNETAGKHSQKTSSSQKRNPLVTYKNKTSRSKRR